MGGKETEIRNSDVRCFAISYINSHLICSPIDDAENDMILKAEIKVPYQAYSNRYSALALL